jgi:hypothetical protein
MSADHARSVVVVASGAPGNSAFGTAFVVRTTKTYDTVVTCAHVVRDVLPQVLVDGQESQIIATGESDGIDLAVLRIPSNGHRVALPLAHHPISDDECTVVAFDELAKSARLVKRAGVIGESHSLAQRRTGKLASTWEITSLDRELLPGNSGAPVLDLQTGLVVGIVSYRLGDTTGLAIAPENLRLIWREAPLQTAAATVAFDTTALQIDLNAWLIPLQRRHQTADRLLLEHKLKVEDKFFLRFERFLDAAHAEQSRVMTTATRHEPAVAVTNGRAFRTLLLATLLRSSESAAKWALAQTVGVLLKRDEHQKQLRDDSVLLAVWKTVCGERGEEVERILRVLFDEMRETGYKKHERLFVFITFLLDRVIRSEAIVRRIANALRDHDDALGNDAPPAYLERVKRLYGQAVAKAEAQHSGPRTFAPDVALIPRNEICAYEFEAMVYPLTVGERARLSGRSASTPTTLPYVFEFQSDEGTLFNLLSSEVSSLVNLCNDFNAEEQYVWDVPTICEWLALAGCIDHKYPWGDMPPTPELANLAFTKDQRIKPVGTYPRGASPYKTLDCCGNVHEIVVSSPAALSAAGSFPADYRLMGGCFRTPPTQAACDLVRPFRPKENEERKNVGLRLIRFSRYDRDRRREALAAFLNSSHRAARFRGPGPYRHKWRFW